MENKICSTQCQPDFISDDELQPAKRKKECTPACLGTSDGINHCSFFVLRKKRFCKMSVKQGEEYCGEHKKINPNFQPNTSIKDTASRIICPLDGKHTCYAHNLKKHLKICNARPKPAELYISKGINSGIGDEKVDNSYRLLSTFSETQIITTISKVNTAYERFLKNNINEKYSTNKLLEEEMLKPEYGFKTKKHLKQVSSILGLIEDYKLLKSGTCYVEFGAGRGQLSFWLAKTIEDKEESKILLIERASPKHKKDNKLAKTSDNLVRIRADISDIVLDNLDVINKSPTVVGVTKHLCGEATDLAIRSLVNIKQNSAKVGGCILTFCCHHRCRWVPYTGRDFFKENNMDKTDFDIMCGMASWATCGTGLSRELRKEISETNLKQNERDLVIGLSRQEKEEIGRRSKNVLNWGRLEYLKNNNFKCYLHYYVDRDITLENVCIVAIR